jgi:hypothetical protein
MNESEIIHVTDVQPLDGLWIRVTFSDGAVKEIDLSELVAGGGVFAPIYEQREVFEQVRVDLVPAVVISGIASVGFLSRNLSPSKQI